MQMAPKINQKLLLLIWIDAGKWQRLSFLNVPARHNIQISSVLKTILRFGFCFLWPHISVKMVEWCMWIDYILIFQARINLNIYGRTVAIECRVHFILVNVENICNLCLSWASIHMMEEKKNYIHPPVTYGNWYYQQLVVLQTLVLHADHGTECSSCEWHRAPV